MTGNDEPRTNEDAEKDLYPPDSDFGRAAAADQERAARGEEPAEKEAPRAGSKAEPDGDDEVDELDEVDEASRDSFPASDPPSSTGSTAGD